MVDLTKEESVYEPEFWTDENNNHPNKFELIRKEDILNGKWKPANFNLLREGFSAIIINGKENKND